MRTRGRRTEPYILLPAVSLALAAACMSGTPRPPCREDGVPIGTICGFRNPEDLEYVVGHDVILAVAMRFDRPVEDGGFISAIVPGGHRVWTAWPAAGADAGEPEPALGDPSCGDPPDRDAFYPHGLTSTTIGGRTLVYVTAHAGDEGGREAVEIFELGGSGENARLTWKACIPTLDAVQANDVAVTADGRVIVSNYQPDGRLIHTVEAALLGRTTGNVMVWSRAEGWRAIEGTDSLLANGVAVSADGQTLFYTETITGILHRRPLAGPRGAIEVEIGGNPDNLTWTPRDTLLVATHDSGVGLMLCNFGKTPCTTPWTVYEVDPWTLASKRVLSHDGSVLGAVTTAVEVGGRLYLGSVYGDRIGVITLTGQDAGRAQVGSR